MTLGGSSHEVGRGITVDQSGNVYVTGYTYSSDFPMVNALYPILDSGYPGYDAFIVKLNPRGTDIIYSTYLGGNAGDEGYGIAVDESGNACIAGITRSSNFPTVNPLYPNYAGDGDVFIFKLNASGTAAVYSTYLGGSAADELQDFAIDTSGNAYVTGYTASLNFPTVNALYPNYGGGEHDAFIFKMNPSGTGAVYSTYLGGSNDDNSCGIAVDDSGNAYVVGETGSLNFPTVNALYPNYGGGEREGFIFKMNPNGTEAVYSTYLGGSGQYDAATGIAVDSFGSVYVTGRTDSLNFPMVNALYPTRMGGWWDAFIFKMNPSGTEIVYSTYLGGSSNYDDGRKITVDHSGNAYVAGLTGSSDFPMVNALYPNFGGGEYDAFIFVMKPNGTEAVYSTYLGGSAKDSIMDIAVDGSGNIYVTGVTTSTDFPIVNALYPSFGVGGDGFIVKVSPTPVVPNQPPTAKCQNISVTASPSCNTAASIDNGSSDPDGDKITLSQTPTEPYLLGNTLVTLTVTDSVGASSQCTGMVTVADNTPPTIGDISANPSVLLPTNKMVNVAIDYVPADCQQVSCQISNVTSNQKMKSSDYVIVDAHHVKLKAVKGRIYAIAISCRDASGNSSSQTVTVTTTKR